MRRGIAIGLCSGLLLVLSAGSALACNFPSWLRAIGPVGADGTIQLLGGGFEAGHITFLWDRSDGPVIGETVVGEDGRIDMRLPVPEATGSHKIIAVDQDATESVAHPHAWTDVVLSAPPAGDVTAAPAPAAADADGFPWPLAVVLLAGAGAAALLVGRRRSAGATDEHDWDVELQRLLDDVAADEEDAEAPLVGPSR